MLIFILQVILEKCKNVPKKRKQGSNIPRYISSQKWILFAGSSLSSSCSRFCANHRQRASNQTGCHQGCEERMKTITIIMTMSILISKVLLKALALQTSLVVIKDVRLGRPALYIVYKKKVKVKPKSQCPSSTGCQMFWAWPRSLQNFDKFWFLRINLKCVINLSFFSRSQSYWELPSPALIQTSWGPR